MFEQSLDPVIVYGWAENNQDTRICDEWLDTHEVELYGIGVDNLLISEPVYGLACPISLDTGMPVISLEERLTVDNAYFNYQKTHPNATKLGFHLAIDGAFDSDQVIYDPSDVEDPEVMEL